MAIGNVNYDEFDDAKPSTGSTLETLPDGEYEFEIKSVADVKRDKGGKISFHLEVISAPLQGAEVDFERFITSQETMGFFLADLKRLGFDCDNWKAGTSRTNSSEIPKALAVCPGMRFKGKKVTNEKGGKQYHNLYINERLPGDGKPAAFGEKEMAEAAEALKKLKDDDAPF